MFKIPAPIMRAAGKAGNWLVKNGPTIMSVSGGLMAVGGAVMACEATLKVDEVLERHKQKMERIEEAVTISESNGDDAFTDKDAKRAKFETYRDTTIELVKLYGPAVAVGMSGVGLMQTAFVVTERRRSTAVAALASLNQAYTDLLARGSNKELMEPIYETQIVEDEDSGEEFEQIIIDPENAPEDPFFYIFDETNPNWYNKNAFLLNERFLTATIDAYNYRLSSHAVDHVWVNDLLKSWSMKDNGVGHFHGWNANTGDIIEYDIVPFLKVWNDDDDSQIPMLVETDMETLRELESNDIQEGYCIGIRLKSSSDGYDDVTPPRFIYNEVYGG